MSTPEDPPFPLRQLDMIEESRLWALDPNGDWIEVSVNANGEIDTNIQGGEVGLLDSGGTRIDPATAALEDALQNNAADVFRTRLTTDAVYDSVSRDHDGDASNETVRLVDAAIRDSAGTVIDVLTQDPLNSVGNDELVSRITDSAGTQIDPLTQDVFQSVAADELRARLHDSTGTQIDPLNQTVLASVAGDQVRVDLENNNAGTLATEQQTPVGIEDSVGTQVDPATSGNQQPTAQARVFNTSVNSGTDILGSDVTPNNNPSALKVTISVDTASTLTVDEDNGTSEVSYDLNDGASIDAGELYTFTVPVRSAASYNFQIDSNATVKVLNVDEVPGAMA